MSSEEEDYRAEKLISKRLRDGVAEYETQWTGCSFLTWEPAETLPDTLVAEFEAANPAQPTCGALSSSHKHARDV